MTEIKQLKYDKAYLKMAMEWGNYPIVIVKK